MSKILNAAAFATGYVLGARAGRGRYEQIVRTASRLREDAPDLAAQVRGHGGSGSDGGGSSEGDDTASSSAGAATASTPMYSAPSPDAGPAPDDTAGVPAPGTSGAGEDEQNPMYSAPSPGAGPAPEGSGSATSTATTTGTGPDLEEGHVDVEEEVVYSSGPDVDSPIEELTDQDPR